MAEEMQPGSVIAGRYRLAEPLGAGGFGRVWKAYDSTLRLDVAVKQVWLPPAIAETERAERLERATREARNAAKLRDHPNIVAVHDVFVEQDAPWIVMQLVDGGSLEDRLRADGPLPVDRAIEVATAVLAALGAAHRADVLHRDVKPANVLLGRDGAILLTDFGIAVHRDDPTMTLPGTLVGSVEYMAPERLQGSAALPASDLFGLGATLYQAVEGVSPFHRDTITAAMAAVMFDPAPVPAHAGEPLTTLIDRLLRKDPSNRPDVAQALVLAGSPGLPSLPGGAASSEVAEGPTARVGQAYADGGTRLATTTPATEPATPTPVGTQQPEPRPEPQPVSPATPQPEPQSGPQAQQGDTSAPAKAEPTGKGVQEKGSWRLPGSIVGIVLVLVALGVVGAVVEFRAQPFGSSLTDTTADLIDAAGGQTRSVFVMELVVLVCLSPFVGAVVGTAAGRSIARDAANKPNASGAVDSEGSQMAGIVGGTLTGAVVGVLAAAGPPFAVFAGTPILHHWFPPIAALMISIAIIVIALGRCTQLFMRSLD